MEKIQYNSKGEKNEKKIAMDSCYIKLTTLGVNVNMKMNIINIVRSPESEWRTVGWAGRGR